LDWKQVRRFLVAIEARAKSLYDWLCRQQSGALGAFHRSGGNEQLVDALPLSSTDTVIDAGAYEGQWTDEILCRYGCGAILVEPIPSFASRLRERYKANDRVELVQAALGNRSARASISVADDGSSIYRTASGSGVIEIDVLDVSAFLNEKLSGTCGCLKLNIEGSEYDVLERLLADGCAPKIKVFLIQFHDLVRDSATRREKIQRMLTQTHAAAFDYPFVWECWIRK
jgi:FkbM family methyltransferase